MNITVAGSGTNEVARRRLLSIRLEPLFYATWDNAVFIHYETDPRTLQQCAPYDVDLYDGRAFVSVVAFTMREMRPRFGGRLAQWLLKPIATHNFLNVRTYVRHRGEAGIYFMSEWLSNRISTFLGPSTFGLPYRFAQIDYQPSVAAATYGSTSEHKELRGTVLAKEGRLSYRAKLAEDPFETSKPDSLTEFLIERYTAFTQHGRRRRFFRVWHEPWLQVPIDIEIVADELINATGNWWRNAQCAGANFSPGVSVWMGWPHRINS